MTIIDRYLLRQFVWIFFIIFCSLLGLYVVADSVNNFEEFASYGRSNGGLLRVIGEYYGYRSIAFFDQASPILIMVAAMFTIAGFRRHAEMTALLAAGISKPRIIRPIILATVALALFAAANRELLLPSIRENLGYNAQDLVKDKAFERQYDNDTGILLGGAGVQRHVNRITKPSFLLPRTLDHYGYQLVAEEAAYFPPQGDRPGGYLMLGMLQPDGLADKPSLQLGDRTVIVTPKDSDWLEPDQCFVVSGVQFDQLAAGGAWRNFASTAELVASLRNPSIRHGANVQVEVHARLVQPLLDVTLLFLGLPVVLTRQTRSIFVSIGGCVLLVVGFMVAVLLCHQFGANGTLTPALAAWMPVMIFVPIAVGMSDALRD